MDIATAQAKPPYRKLVSVRRVSCIKPLESSETHEVVMVGGWPVVLEKGQFTKGQPILYFEIDSFLPLNDKRYETFQSSHTYAELHGQKGYVVQTVMLEGHVSQGMVFCIDYDFHEVINVMKKLGEGHGRFLCDVYDKVMELDLTDELKVKKWTTFYRLDGGVDLGRPPDFVPATKLARAQNLADLWETHGDTEFQITEMLDGMPMIVYHVKEDGPEYLKLPGLLLDDDLAGSTFSRRSGTGISIGNHDYAETEESKSWAVLRRQEIIEELGFREDQTQVVMAGVLYGEGISSNFYKISGCRFDVYAVSDAHSKARFTIEESEAWREKFEGTFQFVPTFARRIRLSAFAKNIDELMMKADGDSHVFTQADSFPKRKGLVFKTLDGSFSFKAISNDWLLDETDELRNMGEDMLVSRPGPKDCV